jgi:V8-like Glu-specific endopeptidase
VSFVDDRVVHNLIDTYVCSSGSPVFDGDGRFTPVHHAGGRPTSVLGQSPIRKNGGIRISTVTADLADAGINKSGKRNHPLSQALHRPRNLPRPPAAKNNS